VQASGQLAGVELADWTAPTIPSWRHSIWVGVWDPWIVVRKPWVWYKTTREIVTLERMHRAFDDGLMEVRRRGRVAGKEAPHRVKLLPGAQLTSEAP
jgi:MPBQ/MSBQ methyltransferase